MSTAKANSSAAYPPFTWSEISAERVIIYWCGKQVLVIKGARAVKLLDKLANSDMKQQQLLLAKVTGNFKRGNER